MMEEAKQIAFNDRLVDAILQASPKIKTPGRQVEIMDVGEVLQKLQAKLQEPLDMEERRRKVLQLVRGA